VRQRSRAGSVDTARGAARENAREGAAHAGKLETGALALIGLARELDAELAAWHAGVEEAPARLAKPR
jgi:hypothetical protein